MKNGENIEFHENGNVLNKGDWMDKRPIGNHKFYYPSGNIEFEVEYSDENIKKLFANVPGFRPGVFANHHLKRFPEKGRIINEKWYNEDGSLMSADEIIKKGGIDPRKKPQSSNIRYSWAHDLLNQEHFVVINGLNFGQIKIS